MMTRFYFSTKLKTLPTVAALLALAQPASADAIGVFDVQYGDEDDAGFLDVFFHTYESEFDDEDGEFDFDMENLDTEDSIAYLGGTSATDFHLTFNGAVTLVADDDDVSNLFTHGGESNWDVMSFGNEIWFIAPEGVTLDAGEQFQIAVFAEVTTSGYPLSVTGAWTNDGVSVVPEPATLLLLGTGLAALAVRNRRRRK